MFYVSHSGDKWSVHNCTNPPHDDDEILTICGLDHCLTGDILTGRWVMEEDLSYACLGSRHGCLFMITSNTCIEPLCHPVYLGDKFETQAPFAIGVANHTGKYPLPNMEMLSTICDMFAIKQPAWCEHYKGEDLTDKDVNYKDFMESFNEGK